MEHNYCPNCGKELQNREAEFCPNCGVRMNGSPPKKGKNRGITIGVIILVAIVFIVVFSYVALGAGFFTTQKLQPIQKNYPTPYPTFTTRPTVNVYQGAPDFVIKGDIYGLGNPNNNYATINRIQFDIGIAAGGKPVDVSKLLMIWYVPNQAPEYLDYTTSTPVPGTWSVIKKIGGSNQNDTLEREELFRILLYPPNDIEPRKSIDFDIKPPSGSSLNIQRSIPSTISQSIPLY